MILPGGFSYGDYLRSGALAAHSPVMQAVKSFADQGRPVLGICNGFQILTETRILPGALLANDPKGFICKTVPLHWLGQPADKTFNIPIAHGEGRYYADASTLKDLQTNNQILLRTRPIETQMVAPRTSQEFVTNVVSLGHDATSRTRTRS